MALVSTPLIFGAKNWVVYIVFEEELVAAVLVRTEDTRYDRPEGSPEDRVRDGRKSWLIAVYALLTITGAAGMLRSKELASSAESVGVKNADQSANPRFFNRI